MAAPLQLLRLPLSPVEESLDNNDEFPFGISYLHPLALGSEGETWAKIKSTEGRDNAFGLSLPENIVPTRPRRRRGLHTRSFSEPFAASKRMATVTATPLEETDTAPSSPPELSYSKSSKSSGSSIRSDSSDEDETTEKGSQFEDVSIADERRESNDNDDSNLRPESRPTLKRPPPRAFTSSDSGRTVTRGVDPALNSLPNGLGLLRRGFTSPSTPALFTGSYKPSRSPSPTKPFTQNGVSVSPSTLASATPRLVDARSPGTPSGSMFSRRKSWQPGQRKTAKEIEADYNDDDVEVPDDFILENVPISPMPGQPRLSQSLSRPQSRPESRSNTPSPQRRASHASLHSANVPKNAKRPSAPTVLPNGQYGSPRSPRHTRPNTLQHSNTISAFPASPQMHKKQRSKSWTEDLNIEAKRLSAALEAYAERSSLEKHSSEGQTASSSPPPSSPPEPYHLQRAKSATFDLAQVQRGSIMIDPLPISKEKEAVLARTRPSWLPPKDPKEDKRHLREWEQMMARAAENEKKRALQLREKLETQIEMKDSMARIWDQHVLPNWEAVLKEPRTRELWWRGVTPRSRGVVWQKAIGNELGLSETSFSAALKRADALEEKVSEMTQEERSKSRESAWFRAIDRDVQTASPEGQLASPADVEPFRTALRNVLMAYSMYRSDVGYVYGTHLVAALLCLHLKPADAFVTLANMLNRPLPLAFLVHDVEAMKSTYECVLSTLNYKFTKLYAHLTSPAIGLRPEEYLDPMFRCLFAYHLPFDCVSRVWDIFVFEGDKALVRVAVGILGKLEGKLYGSREEILDVIGWCSEGMFDIGSEEEFVKGIRDAGKVESKDVIKRPKPEEPCYPPRRPSQGV